MGMGITVYKCHAYDDVTLLASTDLEASQWELEVEGDNMPAWLHVTAVIMDTHLNWSTTDLSLWEGLYRGDAAVIRQAFPRASDVVPAGVPFAVMWNVSNWVYGDLQHSFRFIDPRGSIYDFQHDWRQPQHSFG